MHARGRESPDDCFKTTEFVEEMCLSSVMSDSLRVLWTVALQAPLSMGFSRQEHWSGLPSPPPGGLPNPGIECRSPGLQADSLPFSEPPGKPMEEIDGVILCDEVTSLT